MFYLIIYFISFMSMSTFLFMVHPLAMGLNLMMQTILICLISGTMMKTFWFSYVLFLIFLGGMLVLFIYVTSLASNEMFSFSLKTLLFLSISLILSTAIILPMDKFLMTPYFMNYETSSMSEMKMYLLENSLMLNKLYNFPINMLTMILMIYLLLTLIAVVKITNIFEGPLRPKT